MPPSRLDRRFRLFEPLGAAAEVVLSAGAQGGMPPARLGLLRFEASPSVESNLLVDEKAPASWLVRRWFCGAHGGGPPERLGRRSREVDEEEDVAVVC